MLNIRCASCHVNPIAANRSIRLVAGVAVCGIGSGKPARMIITVAPAGLEQISLEVGQPIADDATSALPPSQEEIKKLLAVAPRYGFEIKLPVLSGGGGGLNADYWAWQSPSRSTTVGVIIKGDRHIAIVLLAEIVADFFLPAESFGIRLHAIDQLDGEADSFALGQTGAFGRHKYTILKRCVDFECHEKTSRATGGSRSIFSDSGGSIATDVHRGVKLIYRPHSRLNPHVFG